ncbi:Positive regulator of CheA protein activity (CheW) [Candidatus Rhodobacter oscarellae]|uniref:Positive regulator of CheA protein activity (CheW) n=1 Tax=Candidatus Rhodobacter oscarellae TaxID=1675527 RepID=A0A0J9E344_9RHOB|nr:chemotaxis protein CheW [Candidatus Rhodobacter lobularis]KMW56219.1 Positive regulator of CheA protein activity (CheW) [Candidatus Rhodobacter lobularis]
MTADMNTPIAMIEGATRVDMPADPPADPAGAAEVLDEIYGSFWIEDTEFAIPADSLQEVVNQPDAVSAVPLAPDHLLGLFDLRGDIIPIVDLRRFLGFPEVNSTEIRKVAIISNGDLSIGLMFDATGELLHKKDAVHTDFRKIERERKDVVVEGVLRFDDGKRIVQIIDPHEILCLEKVPRAPAVKDTASARNMLGTRRNCISFQLGHTCFALDLRHVQEITEMMEIDQSHFAHGAVLGTANLRGTVLPVVDFRGHVGGESSSNLNLKKLVGRKIIILNSPNGPIGFMVYSIDSIIPYYERDIVAFAKVALPRNDIVGGCIVDDEAGLVLMIDPDKLVNNDSIARTAKACRQIYVVDHKSEKESTRQVNVQRKTFIVVSIGSAFAVDMTCVSEVINRPEKLLAPPYRLPFVEGIIKLRGELITLINPRLLYGMEPVTSGEEKILIFTHKGTKYAILVDSIDEIMMTNDQQLMNSPKIGDGSSGQEISRDMEGCLSLGDSDDADIIMVLDPSALVARSLAKAQAATLT